MYKNLQKNVNDVFLAYKKAHISSFKQEKRIIELTHNKKPLKLSNDKYIATINKTIELMEKNNAEIINNEFITKNRDVYWWTQYYSKSTYYRTSKKAYSEFLEILFS